MERFAKKRGAMERRGVAAERRGVMERGKLKGEERGGVSGEEQWREEGQTE